MLAVLITGITPLGGIPGSSFLTPPPAVKEALPRDPKELERVLERTFYPGDQSDRIISGGIGGVERLLTAISDKTFSSQAREAAIDLIGEIFANLPPQDRDQISQIDIIKDPLRISRLNFLEETAEKTTDTLVNLLRDKNEKEMLHEAAVSALAQMQEFAETAILAMAGMRDARMRDYCFEALGGWLLNERIRQFNETQDQVPPLRIVIKDFRNPLNDQERASDRKRGQMIPFDVSEDDRQLEKFLKKVPRWLRGIERANAGKTRGIFFDLEVGIQINRELSHGAWAGEWGKAIQRIAHSLTYPNTPISVHEQNLDSIWKGDTNYRYLAFSSAPVSAEEYAFLEEVEFTTEGEFMMTGTAISAQTNIAYLFWSIRLIKQLIEKATLPELQELAAQLETIHQGFESEKTEEDVPQVYHFIMPLTSATIDMVNQQQRSYDSDKLELKALKKSAGTFYKNCREVRTRIARAVQTVRWCQQLAARSSPGAPRELHQAL